MRYALAYPDPISMQLVRVIALSGSDEIVGALVDGPWRKEITDLGIPAAGSVDELLAIGVFDAVIVGDGGAVDARTGLVRALFQAEIPLIVIHPVGDMLFGFELQMAQAATKIPILPFVPAVFHPFIHEIARSVGPETTQPAEVRRVLIDRRSSVRGERAIEALFCRDALLLRLLVGKIVRVSALRAWGQPPAASSEPGGESRGGTGPIATDGFQSWTVQMLDEHGRDIQWRIQSATEDKAEMVIQGDQRTWEIVMPEDPEKWSGRVTKGQGQTETLPSSHAPATAPYIAALDMMAAAIESEAGRQVADTYWDHACRAVELSDAVARSGRRGRAIDLYHEEHSEESTFKGVMAAGGCIALLVALALIPMVAIGEQLLPDAEPGSGWLRFPWLLLAVVLTLFLVLQLLRLVIKRA